MNVEMLVKSLTIAGLFAMMLAMGCKVTMPQFVSTIWPPRKAMAGVVANFVLVPAATIGLLYAYDANPMVSMGFLILAVSPGAPVGPPFAAIAKGDIPYAIGQMVVLACLSVLITPALLTVATTRWLPAGDLRINYLSIVSTLLVAQLLPLGLGLGLRQWAPGLTSRIARPLGLLANLLLLGVIMTILAQQWQTLAVIRPRGWMGMLLLVACSLGIGWVCGGPNRATRKALALTTSSRNAAVALVIVSESFPGTPAVTAVVAFAIFSILATLGCAYLLALVPESVGA